MDSEAEGGHSRWIAAFVGLAIVAGPVRMLTSNPFYFGLPWPTAWTSAMASGIAGLVLLGLCVAKGWALPDARAWGVLVVLQLPQWAAGVTPLLGLHGTSWGVVELLGLAAPLWLALLAAVQLIRVEVPRSAVGAGIAGVGAVCLMIPMNAYRVALNQIPMLIVHLLISIATVYTWAYAAPRLASSRAIAYAGGFLLLQALSGLGAARWLENADVRPIDWHGAWLAMVVQAAVSGGCYFLWFWLLRRIPLAALCMTALATWTASMLPGVWLGFAQWRVVVAPAIALAAVVVGVRARVADEQPTALGLRET